MATLTSRVGNGAILQRRVFLFAGVVSCVVSLTACAGISPSELKSIGSEVVHTRIDFGDIYIYAERSNASYQDKKAIKAKYPFTVRINSPDGTQVRYFLERNDKSHTQFITVRGTDNNKNLDEDLDIALREDRQVDIPVIPVHAGFDAAARAVHNDLKPQLKPGYRTYMTGHSLGGAVAALLAIYLLEDGVQVERVVTFGEPRFTTAAGAKRLGFLPLTRVVDENDIVPLVPPSTFSTSAFGPYDQVGSEVILLEGPEFVFLPSHDADRIALGEFWRSLSFADLNDHQMQKYLRRIASKMKEAVEVPYTQREKYIITSAEQVRY
jgi:triacylglycerol lipase